MTCLLQHLRTSAPTTMQAAGCRRPSARDDHFSCVARALREEKGWARGLRLTRFGNRTAAAAGATAARADRTPCPSTDQTLPSWPATTQQRIRHQTTASTRRHRPFQRSRRHSSRARSRSAQPSSRPSSISISFLSAFPFPPDRHAAAARRQRSGRTLGRQRTTARRGWSERLDLLRCRSCVQLVARPPGSFRCCGLTPALVGFLSRRRQQ